MKFRLKLFSPYLFKCLFTYIHLNSELDVKCNNSQMHYIFCFLIEKIARGKKPPVSLLEHIYGLTDFLDQPRKCSQKRLIILMYFTCNICKDKWFYIENEVLSHKKP